MALSLPSLLQAACRQFHPLQQSAAISTTSSPSVSSAEERSGAISSSYAARTAGMPPCPAKVGAEESFMIQTRKVL